MKMLIKLQFLFIYLSFHNAYGEDDKNVKDYATSVIRTTELVQIEKDLIKMALDNIQQIRKKLTTIESLVKDFEAKNKEIGENAEDYLANPLHGFSLIRRMHADWPKLFDYMQKQTMGDLANFHLPTSLDIADAVKGLERITFYYQMSPKYLAEGLYGKDKEPLSCRDLEQISSTFYELKSLEDAEMWLPIAVEKCLQRNQAEHIVDRVIYQFQASQLYELYVKILLSQDRVEEALKISKTALQLDPFDKQLQYEFQSDRILKSKMDYIDTTKVLNENYDGFDEFLNSCRSQNYNLPNNLHCRLSNFHSAFHILAPFKMEELNLDPFVALYHDIVTENVLTSLKTKYQSSLVHAEVISEDKTVIKFEGRKAHTNFFYDELTEKISQSVADISGLNQEGFEMLSLINYGIGGHYESHTDFFFPDGNRVATALLYMNNVEFGGDTSFPLLNLLVHPQKGSLLFWYNLKNDGEPDDRSLHGACPTILGSKWVATIWIHYEEQFRHKLCYKNVNHNKSL